MAGDGPSQRLREGSDHTHQLPQDTVRSHMSGKAWGERLLAMVKERQRQKETLQEQEQDRQYSPIPPSLTERHKEILQLPEQLSLEKPIRHYTDTGRKIESMHCYINPETRVSEERYLDSLDPNKKPTVLYYASDFPNTNCHGFTFTNSKVGWLNPRHVQHILDDNGFTKIGTFENNAELIDHQLQIGVTPQIGDIVIFRKKEGGLLRVCRKERKEPIRKRKEIIKRAERMSRDVQCRSPKAVPIGSERCPVGNPGSPYS